MQGCQSMKLKYTNGLLEVCKVAAAVIRMATDGMAYAPLVQMPDIKCRCDPKRRASSSFTGCVSNSLRKTRLSQQNLAAVASNSSHLRGSAAIAHRRLIRLLVSRGFTELVSVMEVSFVCLKNARVSGRKDPRLLLAVGCCSLLVMVHYEASFLQSIKALFIKAYKLHG